jgi:hypothetical protein
MSLQEDPWRIAFRNPHVIVKLSTVTYNETTFTMPIQETRAQRRRGREARDQRRETRAQHRGTRAQRSAPRQSMSPSMSPDIMR